MRFLRPRLRPVPSASDVDVSIAYASSTGDDIGDAVALPGSRVGISTFSMFLSGLQSQISPSVLGTLTLTSSITVRVGTDVIDEDAIVGCSVTGGAGMGVENNVGVWR